MFKSQITPNNHIENPHPNLGMLLDDFPRAYRKLYQWIWFVLGFLFLFFGTLLSIRYFFKTLSAIQIHGRASLLSPNAWLIFAVLIFLPPGIAFIYNGFLHKKDGFHLYENGFLIQNCKREQVWLWKNITRLDTPITHVKFGGDTIITRSMLILNAGIQNGKILTSRYERDAELIQKVREIVLPMLFDSAQKRLKNNETLDFGGQISANQLGLVIQENHFEWGQLCEPLIDQATLKILTCQNQNPVFRTKISQIKNLDVLIHLIKNPPTSVN